MLVLFSCFCLTFSQLLPASTPTFTAGAATNALAMQVNQYGYTQAPLRPVVSSQNIFSANPIQLGAAQSSPTFNAASMSSPQSPYGQWAPDNSINLTPQQSLQPQLQQLQQQQLQQQQTQQIQQQFMQQQIQPQAPQQPQAQQSQAFRAQSVSAVADTTTARSLILPQRQRRRPEERVGVAVTPSAKSLSLPSSSSAASGQYAGAASGPYSGVTSGQYSGSPFSMMSADSVAMPLATRAVSFAAPEPSFAPPSSSAASALYKPPTEDPCLIAKDACSCYLLGGSCGWSTTYMVCDSVSNTECLECPFMPGCDCRSGSACGCAKLGPPCGWSRSVRACLKGFTTECDECNDQQKCSAAGHPTASTEPVFDRPTSPPSSTPSKTPPSTTPSQTPSNLPTTKPPTSPPSRKPTIKPSVTPTIKPTSLPTHTPTTNAPSEQNVEISEDQKEILVRWVYNPRPFPTIKGNLGQSLRFIFNSDHDVWAFRTLTAYDTCNFSRAVLQADTDIGGGEDPWTNSFQVLFDRPGILLFACSQEDHCRNGNMKLRVEVAAS